MRSSFLDFVESFYTCQDLSLRNVKSFTFKVLSLKETKSITPFLFMALYRGIRVLLPTSKTQLYFLLYTTD